MRAKSVSAISVPPRVPSDPFGTSPRHARRGRAPPVSTYADIVSALPEVDLNSEAVQNLQNALTEAVRASEEGVQRFIEPASGPLRVALSRRPHLIFGRRGSGKTSLLRKAIAEHNLDRRLSAFVDLEPFKGHTYPDVLISVLNGVLQEPATLAGRWSRGTSQPGEGLEAMVLATPEEPPFSRDRHGEQR